ncbi:membrane protein [Bartonella senegalensis]|uniref:membrane protein n=1 Tax=Bartonella senegalensis TaxID=1468418 RepID=UPI0002E7CC46|nr:membrane protein [Bartonella senegalensis]
MVDFVGILKKTINAQNNVTTRLRKQIYKRAIETLEQQFLATRVPQAIADEQRKILQSAIATVEAEYLAVEKELLSSVIGWNPKSITQSGKYTYTSLLPQGHEFSVVETEGRQDSIISSKNHQVFVGSSVSALSDAEPVNMEACLASQCTENNTLRVSPLASPSQGDNPHIVSHIFSQAMRRANRASMQRRIVISAAFFIGFFTLMIGICFVGGRMLVSSDPQFLGGNVQASHVLSQAFSVKRKLTQRLLEDGSEVDTNLEQTTVSSNAEGISTAVSSNLQSMEQLGEAVFYQARTDYDAEKVATGSARWTLIKRDPEESAIQGDITIPDKGLSLRLILRRNTDVSFPAAYIMDLIFILSDKFSGQAISNVQALTFKASEQSIGQALTRTVAAKIDDDFFLVALSGKHPFLNRNLQLMKELDWMRLVLTDKNGRTNELTFAKGPTGESIFNKVIGKWLEQPEKLTVLGQKK